MQPPNDTNTDRVGRLVASLLYLGMVTFMLAGVSDTPLLTAAILVLGVHTVTLAAILIFAVRFAQTERGAPLRFRISSLLLVTVVLAVYMGAARWVTEGVRGEVRPGEEGFVFATCLIALLLTAPAWICVSEPLMAWAAQAVRKPWARRLVKRMLGGQEQS